MKIITPNWDKNLPEEESQVKNRISTRACLSHAVANMYEALFNYAIENKMIPDISMDFLKKEGFLLRGKFQVSKRYIATLSETSREGNSFYKVIEAVMKYGLVPEVVFPWDDDITTWDGYYTWPEDYVLEHGKKFLEEFNLEYGWVNKIEKYLKQSPLVIFVNAWYKNDEGKYYREHESNNHGTLLIDKWTVWDSLPPEWKKELDESNYPSWGVYGRIFINKKDNMSEITQWLKDNDQKTVFNSDTGETGFIVRGVLATFDDLEEKVNGLYDMKNRGVIADPAIHIQDDKWQNLPKKRFKDL